MRIQCYLAERSQIAIQLSCEDVDAQCASYAQIYLSADEARQVVSWLKGDRTSDCQTGSHCIRGGSNWLVIEESITGLVIRLGRDQLLNDLLNALAGCLALHVGEPCDP